MIQKEKRRCFDQMTCYLNCACNSDPHTIKFSYFDPPEGISEDYVSIHYFLETRGVFWRIWFAIKYILGFKSVFGQFGETILEPDSVRELKELCDGFLETHKLDERQRLKKLTKVYTENK